MIRRIHLGECRGLGSLLPSLRQRPYSKPKGLWYSIGWEWIEWIRGEQWEDRIGGRRCFELDVDTSKILTIGRDISLEDFDKEYRCGIICVDGVEKYVMKIDWPRIAERWSGIEIPVYEYNHRFDMMWYYGWDVASGCIWKQDAILGHRRVAWPRRNKS